MPSKCVNSHHLQTVRARVVGDLPVALGIKEMMRQVHALQLAVTGVYVDLSLIHI